jgi:hypothetical protein
MTDRVEFERRAAENEALARLMSLEADRRYFLAEAHYWRSRAASTASRDERRKA